jgi:carbonic anhydrase
MPDSNNPSGPIISESTCEWSYSGSTGPGAWGDIESNGVICYPQCDLDNNSGQSPIDIVTAGAMLNGQLTNLVFYYIPWTYTVASSHNNFVVSPNTQSGPQNILSYNGAGFSLIQFHFHTLSEHTINGVFQAMEVHLVHSNGVQTLVVGILMQQQTGDPNNGANPVLGQILQAIPWQGPLQLNAAQLLPPPSNTNPGSKSPLQYYTYTGSLTTPPCSPNITWVVLPEMITVSQAQVGSFQTYLQQNYGYGSNARPVQPLNDRIVSVSPPFTS